MLTPNLYNFVISFPDNAQLSANPSVRLGTQLAGNRTWSRTWIEDCIVRNFVHESKTDLAPDWLAIWTWSRTWIEDCIGRNFIRELKTDLAPNLFVNLDVNSSVISSMISNLGEFEREKKMDLAKNSVFSWNTFRVLNVSFRCQMVISQVDLDEIPTNMLPNWQCKAKETWTKSLRKWCQIVISN